eukprot:667966-Karenia_brevis.AAC.1
MASQLGQNWSSGSASMNNRDRTSTIYSAGSKHKLKFIGAAVRNFTEPTSASDSNVARSATEQEDNH